jgi:hypothetical protein
MHPDQVPHIFRQPSAAAKRCSDAVSLAAIAGASGMWVAVRLADGSTDGNVYDSREAAIRHQKGLAAFVPAQVQPGGMQHPEAEAFLDYWRRLSDANVRDDDPGLLLPLMPLTRRDRARQIRVLSKGRR